MAAGIITDITCDECNVYMTEVFIHMPCYLCTKCQMSSGPHGPNFYNSRFGIQCAFRQNGCKVIDHPSFSCACS